MFMIVGYNIMYTVLVVAEGIWKYHTYIIIVNDEEITILLDSDFIVASKKV